MKTSIGNAPWMYEYTKYISKYFPELEIDAQIHDYLYKVFYLWVMSKTNQFFLKILFDLIFLGFGLIRLCLWGVHDVVFKKYGWLAFPYYWFRRCLGIILLIQLYIVLLITTFYPPLWRPKK